MQAVKIYFSHGLESGPNATKIQALMAVAEEFGVSNMVALDYRGIQDPGQRLAVLKQQVESDQVDSKNIILVGSSMGSWVSGKFAETQPVLRCFLLAPAFSKKSHKRFATDLPYYFGSSTLAEIGDRWNEGTTMNVPRAGAAGLTRAQVCHS